MNEDPSISFAIECVETALTTARNKEGAVNVTDSALFLVGAQRLSVARVTASDAVSRRWFEPGKVYTAGIMLTPVESPDEAGASDGKEGG